MSFFQKYKTIDDLELKLSSFDMNSKIYDNRSSVKIAVIDDQDFHPENNLRRNNYNIRIFKDLNSIDDISSCHIILCDLSGVGLALNPELQGAHIIREIKQKYPEKIIIAYTGGSSDTRLYAKSITIADFFTQKDTSLEDWIELLDEAIRCVADPVRVWRNLRPRLLEVGITPFQLTQLEDQFVKSFEKGADEYKNILPRLATKLNLGTDVRSILNSLVANAVFSILIS